MNESIALHDQLLARGQTLAGIGCTAEARSVLRALIRLPEVGGHTRAEAYRSLGRMAADVGDARRARKYFAAAIALEPDVAGTYAGYADAVDADPDADPRKGLKARRRAVALEPQEPGRWCALGQSALRLGKLHVALKAFRRAARLMPNQFDVLADLMAGLMQLGREREAEGVLTAAKFRLPRNPALADLGSRFRYEALRRRQTITRQTTATGGPVILPFPGRPTTDTGRAANPVVIRADRKSRSTPHMLRLFGMRSGPRRAN